MRTFPHRDPQHRSLGLGRRHQTAPVELLPRRWFHFEFIRCTTDILICHFVINIELYSFSSSFEVNFLCIIFNLLLNHLNNFCIQLPHKEKQSTSTSSPPIEAPPSDDGQPNEGHEQPGEVHHVTHLQLLNWSSQSNLPPSELPIIRLVEKIDEIQKKNPDQPIVVHCM